MNRPYNILDVLLVVALISGVVGMCVTIIWEWWENR